MNVVDPENTTAQNLSPRVNNIHLMDFLTRYEYVVVVFKKLRLDLAPYGYQNIEESLSDMSSNSQNSGSSSFAS